MTGFPLAANGPNQRLLVRIRGKHLPTFRWPSRRHEAHGGVIGMQRMHKELIYGDELANRNRVARQKFRLGPDTRTSDYDLIGHPLASVPVWLRYRRQSSRRRRRNIADSPVPTSNKRRPTTNCATVGQPRIPMSMNFDFLGG